jgi:crotonobetainyl-CoA:carnitine CoA-transferase CaiB-like acyl-CoA transferase
VTLTVRTEDEWRGLCRAIGAPEFADDSRFVDAAGRMAHHDAIDARIAEWTAGVEHTEAMRLLQAEGVPSGAVLNAPELLSDAGLSGGFFVTIAEPGLGTFPYPGVPITFDGQRPARYEPAPRLGQDSRAILRDLLHYSDREFEELVRAGVTAEPVVEMTA